MRRARAVKALRQLIIDAEASEVIAGGPTATAWKKKVRGAIGTSLGMDDFLVMDLDRVSEQVDELFRREPSLHEWRHALEWEIREIVSLAEAAIYRLNLQIDGDNTTDDSAFDPELWAHVANFVADENWSAVSSQTAIYLEDTLRRWAEDPKDKNGDSFYGQALYAHVFSDDSDFKLGSRASETQGWRQLAVGFAMALGNVDRHRIQNRHDARRYAIGVLGMASLILTQLRYEHADLINEA